MKTTPHRATLAQTNVDPRNWWIIDLEGKTLGRAASTIAMVLRGKNKATYTPSADMGDFVVAINATKVKLTGKKWDDKTYSFFSGYVGGLRFVTAKDLVKKKPEHLIKHAVQGMLPKSDLGGRLLNKLKVYPGAEHPHAAQTPKTLDIK